MKKSKIIALTLATLMLLTLLAGCGEGGGGGGGDKVTVEWWSLWDAEIDEVMIADFEAEFSDIEIIRTQHGDPGIWEAMVVAIATGVGPDLNFNWSGAFNEMFYRNGGNISMNPYAEEYGWFDMLVPGAMEIVTYDGNLSLIPYQMNAMGLVYKKSTFEQYGLSEPNNYAELANICDTLAANGVVPFSIGGKTNWHAMRWLDAIVDVFAGPEMHDRLKNMDDTSVTWESPEAIAAFQEITEWLDRGWIDPNFLGVDEGETYMPIYTGDAGMNIQGDWVEGNIRDAGFDSNDFGYFPFPGKNGMGRLSAFVSGIALTNFNSDEATDAGAQFLNFIIQDEQVAKYIPMFGCLSGVKSAPVDPSANILNIVLDYLGRCGTILPGDQAFPNETIEVFLNLSQELLSAQTTPEDAGRRVEESLASARANAEN